MELQTYSDEYIHHWGQVFTANNIYARGITFEVFLKSPETIIDKLIFNNPDHWMLTNMSENLLQKQRRVQHQLDRQDMADIVELELVRDLEREPDVHCIHGRYFEPMHHTAWPANHGKGFVRRARR